MASKTIAKTKKSLAKHKGKEELPNISYIASRDIVKIIEVMAAADQISTVEAGKTIESMVNKKTLIVVPPFNIPKEG